MQIQLVQKFKIKLKINRIPRTLTTLIAVLWSSIQSHATTTSLVTGLSVHTFRGNSLHFYLVKGDFCKTTT